jgi:hypothetical protein
MGLSVEWGEGYLCPYFEQALPQFDGHLEWLI